MCERKMVHAELYESLMVEVAGMERAAMIDRLFHFPGQLRLDFSREYLQSCPTEQLRHLLLAALWRSGVKEQS